MKKEGPEKNVTITQKIEGAGPAHVLEALPLNLRGLHGRKKEEQVLVGILQKMLVLFLKGLEYRENAVPPCLAAAVTTILRSRIIMRRQKLI